MFFFFKRESSMDPNRGVLLLRGQDKTKFVLQFPESRVTAETAALEYVRAQFPRDHWYSHYAYPLWWLALTSPDFQQPEDRHTTWPLALFIPFEEVPVSVGSLLLFVNHRPRQDYRMVETTSIEECLAHLMNDFRTNDIEVIHHESGAHSFILRRFRIGVAVKHENA